MNQFKALTLDEVCDFLVEKKKTLIIFHVRPDADAIGSAFALRELLVGLGIPAVCACSDEVPDRLRFLMEPAQGSVVPEEGMEMDHERVIAVDSASPQQLGEIFTRLRRDVHLMIDHHGMGTQYADGYIDSEASATGEIIYTLACRLIERGQLAAIPHRAMTAIYAAICSDTGSFRFANTTPKTLRIAAALLEAGVEGDEVCRNLYESKSQKQIRAEGEAARRLVVHDGGLFASTTLPYSSIYSLGLSAEHMETAIDIPRSLAGVEVAFAIRQPEQTGVFRVSMRSNGALDVSRICAKFGGGGHKRASGCTIEAAHIDDAEDMILNAVREEWQKTLE